MYCRPGKDQNDYVVIREIYENDNATEYFESELEQALDDGVQTIIIEPTKLGDTTAQWITLGNCLHKTAVLSSLGCLATGLVWPERPLFYFPLGFVGAVCTGVYTISWQFDPCCKYQVEYDTRKLQRLPLQGLASSSPVVLVHKDDFRRKILHSTLSLLALSYCGYKVYQWHFQ